MAKPNDNARYTRTITCRCGIQSQVTSPGVDVKGSCPVCGLEYSSNLGNLRYHTWHDKLNNMETKQPSKKSKGDK